MNLFNSKKIQILVIVLLIFLAYSNIFKNEFVLDDSQYFVEWEQMKSLKNIPDMFTYSVGVYRPVRFTIHILSYQVWGSNPFGYHLQAILVHIGITVLVYLIVWEIVIRAWGPVLESSKFPPPSRLRRASQVQSSKLEVRKPASTVTPSPGLIVNHKSLIINQFLPFFAALAFGLHPLKTESVTFMLASFDTVGFLFYFGSFYFFIKAREKLPRYTINYRVSIVLALLAIFIHEMMIILPLVLVLYDFCFTRLQFRKLQFSYFLRVYGLYFLIVFFYLFVRVGLLHIVGRGEYLGGSFYLTMLTMSKALIKYLTLMVWPVDLSLNPTIGNGINSWINPLSKMDRILNQSIFDIDILFGLAVIFGLVLIAIKTFKKASMVTFAIFWFFISLLPAMFIVPQGTIMQERLSYGASFGFVLVLSYLSNLRYLRKAGVILAIFLVIAVFYSVRTYLRNLDWKDSFTLWTKLAEQVPDDILANYYAAGYYQDRGETEKAITIYQRILYVEPRLHEVHYNLGKIYEKQSKIDEAEREYQQALAIYGEYLPAQGALNRIKNAQGAGDLKEPEWVEYSQGHAGYSFFYPNNWQLVKSENHIKIEDTGSDFTVEVDPDLKIRMSSGDYLKTQTESFGKLVNQGPAKIPNVGEAYVKVWSFDSAQDRGSVSSTPEVTAQSTSGVDESITKMQFFLFKGDKVIKIVVFPAKAESPEMKIFEKMIGSFVIS